MATIIKTKKLTINDTGRKLALSKDAEKKINDFWEDLLKVYPWMFNGPVYSTEKMENNDGEVYLEIELSDYANYKCGQVNDLGDYACKNTYAGGILKSADNKFFVSLNGTGSENKGKIQFIGGVIDPDDRDEEGKLDPVKAALREFEEEAGKAIRDSIVSTGDTYLITNEKKYGIQTVFYSSMNSEEILAAFDAFKNGSDNDEIARIVSFGKDNIDELKEYAERHDIGVIDLLTALIKDM
ncbi:MAG: NUDIX hydrolase [Butyrivibrio sp.]|nr:NUDIX hydrolase [Butyrivibrio sp.]